MQAGEFVKKVRERAGLENNESAMAVIDGFFATLRARITHESGDNIAEQLPQDLQGHWEKGFIDHIKRKFSGTERMDLPEFIQRVQQEAKLGATCNAEHVTRSVIITFREAISPGADHTIVSQLPEDIRNFWLSSVPEAVRDEVKAKKPEVMVAGSEGVPADYYTETDYVAHTEHAGPTAMVPEPGTERTEEHVEARIEPPAGEYGPEYIGPSAASLDRSDDQIMRDISDILASNPHIHAGMINVVVHAGKVRLTGIVPSVDEKEHITEVTCRVLGVVDVDNEIAAEQEKRQ